MENSLLKKIGIISAIVGSLFFAGCDRDHYEYVEVSSHPVDQVFRDHDGYRLIYLDENKIVREVKYYSKFSHSCGCSSKPVPKLDQIEGIPENELKNFEQIGFENGPVLIKDLPKNEMGFAKTLKFKHVERGGFDYTDEYTEIHLPSNQNLSPGSETYGGKFQTTQQISEIQ